MAAAAMDFCIPRSKLERAFAEYTENRSTAGIVSLNEQARNLFWSAHCGFAAALQAAGVVEIVGEVLVGPFMSRAYRVRVTGVAL